ncbi:MAG: hypothetical protein E7098_09095 [Mediterranea massiliensis]|nr:hypothetical protein [Mediterranea massiliensis]
MARKSTLTPVRSTPRVPTFFYALALHCHCDGSALPRLWQATAKPMAKCCRNDVEEVPCHYREIVI